MAYFLLCIASGMWLWLACFSTSGWVMRTRSLLEARSSSKTRWLKPFAPAWRAPSLLIAPGAPSKISCQKAACHVKPRLYRNCCRTGRKEVWQVGASVGFVVVHAFKCICIYVSVCVFLYIYTCMCKCYIHVYVYVYVIVCRHMDVITYIDVLVYAYSYTYDYIYVTFAYDYTFHLTTFVPWCLWCKTEAGRQNAALRIRAAQWKRIHSTADRWPLFCAAMQKFREGPWHTILSP